MAISNINTSISKTLILKAQQGDIVARNKVIELAIPKIKMCIRDKENYYDIFQETVFRVIKYLPSFDINKGDFKKWISVVTKNSARQLYEKRIRKISREIPMSSIIFFDQKEIFERKYLSSVDHTQNEQLKKEDILYIINNLLPEKQKVIAELHIIEGLTHEEIAQFLKISPGTSKSNLSRAKKSIVKELTK